jgi:hypothetical protein
MMQPFFHFLDTRPWAPWIGLAACVLASAAVQGSNLPFIW